jgi:hypothetical protein
MNLFFSAHPLDYVCLSRQKKRDSLTGQGKPHPFL